MMINIKHIIATKMPAVVNAINFYYDYRQYNKYNYGNKKNKSFSAFEGKIYRQAHIIEKGLSLSEPRLGFGYDKICVLFEYLDEYIEKGYSTNETVFLNALNVIEKYLKFHKDKQFCNDKVKIVETKLKCYSEYIDNDYACGIEKTTRRTIMNECNKDFESLVMSRHSIRQFSSENITLEEIKRAVKLAIHAPSQCNRQSVKVYCSCDKVKKEKLDKIINGNTGFAKDVNNYLVITSNISSYTSAYERNQMYVDGSLFAMLLMLSLHSYGIGSCALQHSETKEKNLQVKKLLSIPDNEVVVMYLAIGKYKEEFEYALSKRKSIDEVLIIE